MDTIEDVEAPLAGAATFDERRLAKWMRGRAERGLPHDAPFIGDPAAEAREELVDLANYVNELHAQGRIGEEELLRAFSTIVEFDGWLARA
jgi:hypothetical protein